MPFVIVSTNMTSCTKILLKTWPFYIFCKAKTGHKESSKSLLVAEVSLSFAPKVSTSTRKDCHCHTQLFSHSLLSSHSSSSLSVFRLYSADSCWLAVYRSKSSYLACIREKKICFSSLAIDTVSWYTGHTGDVRRKASGERYVRWFGVKTKGL